ncbi:MAG: peptide deformylase [Candidatus Promineifilaceae bacterium]
MTVLDIVTLPNEVLRKKAQPVTKFDDDLQTLIDNMIETMRHAHGVGLAAPQVGIPLRLAVVETLPDTDEEGNDIEGTRDLYVIVNPEIVWTSREMVSGIEGCLSIPGYLGEVYRYTEIRVRAQDRHGKKIRLRLKDWDARIFQHEIDHLDGVLYIDKLTAPENFWTEKAFYGESAQEQETEGQEAGE